MAFVNFDLLKKTIPIEEAAKWMQLKYKKEGDVLRGQCLHGGDNRSLVITPSKSAFYCFACMFGGSVIDLVKHMKKVTLTEAAADLQRHFSPSEPKNEPESHFDPEKVLDRLNFENVGLDPVTAKLLGIGLDPRGLHRGRIAIAIRNPAGRIIAFVSVPVGTEFKVPKSF